MNETVRVRGVQRADFPQWQPLWDGYNSFYGRAAETALAPEITQMTWSRFFDASEPMHALVAETAGRIVGLAHFLYHRSTIQIPPTCYLADLFSAADVRGQGVGRSLIEAVYTHAKLAARLLADSRDQYGCNALVRQSSRAFRLSGVSTQRVKAGYLL